MRPTKQAGRRVCSGEPNEQDCIACHSGGSNMSPAALNIYAEFSKVGHPFPAGTNTHDADEGFPAATGAAPPCTSQQ